MLGRRVFSLCLGAAVAIAGANATIVEPTAHSATGPRAGSDSPRKASRPNIVLITVDSLRSDHLGVYGYARPTSPGIDAFARNATIVSDAIAQAPYTKASIASLLTGLFPSTHQAYTTDAPLDVLQKTGSVGVNGRRQTDVLSADLPSLPVALRAAGYTTIGVSANPYLIPDFGFANGFDTFAYVPGHRSTYARADEVTREAAGAVAQHEGPFFLWIHLMDPHNPYEPSAGFRALLPPLTPPRPIDAAVIPDAVRLGHATDLNLYLARYDAGIREADAAIGRFLRTLQARADWAQTGVVITADHGEGFMDHGLMSHNNSLYDELLHVPLVARLPGVPAGRRRAQVQLADLFPTLCAFAGVTPPPGLHGRNVLPVLAGEDAGEPYAYAELVGRRYALRSLDWKFIASFQGGRQLFDLAGDPGETRNVKDADPETADRLERLLARALTTAISDGQHVTRQMAPVAPQVLDRLRALGYATR